MHTDLCVMVLIVKALFTKSLGCLLSGLENGRSRGGGGGGGILGYIEFQIMSFKQTFLKFNF